MSSRTNPVSERNVNLALHAIIGVSQSQSERLVRITDEANLKVKIETRVESGGEEVVCLSLGV